MTDQTNTATESAAPVAAPALPAAYPSAGPIGAALRAALGGFRAHDVASVPALAAQIITGAPDDSVRAAIAELPVFIAGYGAVTLAALADPETAPALGFDGPATVSILGVRGRTFNVAGEPDPAGKAANADIGLTVIPDHTLSAIMEHPKHLEFLMKIIRKELSHTAANAMGSKDAPLAELAESAKLMPVSVSDYLDRAATTGTGGLYAVFLDNWSGYRAALAENPANAPMLKLLPRKDDMLKAIRSTAYATANFPGIEAKGWFKAIGLRMADVIAAAQAAAAESGEECQITGNPDHLRQWVAERDNVVIDAPSRSVDLDTINPVF